MPVQVYEQAEQHRRQAGEQEGQAEHQRQAEQHRRQAVRSVRCDWDPLCTFACTVSFVLAIGARS